MITQQQDFESLYARFQAGDSTASRELVPLLEPIVISAVRKFVGQGRRNYPMEDFIQEGWDATFLALQTYDIIQYPTLVRSYFYNAVITRLVSVNQQTYMLGLPRAVKRFMRDVNIGKVDWTLSDDDLHHFYPGVPLEDIRSMRGQGDTAVFDVLLTDSQVIDRHVLRSAVTAGRQDERSVNRMVAQDVLFWFLGRLTEREYQVFVLRFVDEKSKTAIAKELGCSVATIDRIEKSILNKR